jgi:hypothetical protein
MKLTTISLLLVSLSFAVPASSQQTGQSGVQSSQKAADRGWPRGYSLPSEAQIVLFQPQIASWENQKQLVAYAAVSHVAKGEQKPALGTIKFATGEVFEDKDRRDKLSDSLEGTNTGDG